MPFVIKRTDQGGGYVARPGLARSHTNRASEMRVFYSRLDAERERCVENEVVVELGWPRHPLLRGVKP